MNELGRSFLAGGNKVIMRLRKL